MWPSTQETADSVKFNEEIPNGKLYFVCSDISETKIKRKTDCIKKRLD